MALMTVPDFQSVCEKVEKRGGQWEGARKAGEAAGRNGWYCVSFFSV